MATFDLLHQQPAFVYGDSDFLRMHKFADGKGFPASYIDFAMKMGWGRLSGLFLIYIPLGQYRDSWQVQSLRIKQLMTAFYEEMEYDPLFVEPAGYPGIESTLVPFARSENGEYLAWDTAARLPNGELPIYVVTAHMGGIRFGGNSLQHFIETCTNEASVKEALGPGYSALPLTFEPLPLFT
jgi:hypothetical protein